MTPYPTFSSTAPPKFRPVPLHDASTSPPPLSLAEDIVVTMLPPPPPPVPISPSSTMMVLAHPSDYRLPSPLPDYNPELLLSSFPPAVVPSIPSASTSAFTAPPPLILHPNLPPVVFHQADEPTQEIYASIHAILAASLANSQEGLQQDNNNNSDFKPPLFFADSPSYATLLADENERSAREFTPNKPPFYTIPCSPYPSNAYQFTKCGYLRHIVRFTRIIHTLSMTNRPYIAVPHSSKSQANKHFALNLAVSEHIIPSDISTFLLAKPHSHARSPAALREREYVFDVNSLTYPAVSQALATFRKRATALVLGLPPAIRPIDCAFDARDPRQNMPPPYFIVGPSCSSLCPSVFQSRRRGPRGLHHPHSAERPHPRA